MVRGRKFVWVVSGGAAGTLVTLMGACGSSGDSVNLGVDDGHDAGIESKPPPVDASFGETSTDDGDVGCEPLQCSSDLHRVVDCKDRIVESCGQDQGCAGAKCVPVCDAAAATKGSVGCDFSLATPSVSFFIDPPCFAVILTNTWWSPAHATVTYDGTAYDVTTFGRIASASPDVTTWAPIPSTGIPPGEVGVLFLSDDSSNVDTWLACPVPPAIRRNGGTAVATPGKTTTGLGHAFHVTTDVPVSAYDEVPFGAGGVFFAGGELVLPTSTWGTNYVAVVGPTGKEDPFNDFKAQTAILTAAQDGTTIQINPVTALPGSPAPDGGVSDGGAPDGGDAGSVAPAPKGVISTYTLNAGEFIQWQPTGEMSGSIIQSDKPISFMGGQIYLCLSSATSNGGGCDSAHQMIPPVSALGFEYAPAPYSSRDPSIPMESLPYRVVGAADGTTLTYDPPVPGAPATLARSQVVDFEAMGPFVIRSQDKDHPFYVGQMMTGSDLKVDGGVSATIGDEEWVNVLPPVQFLSKYVFFTDPSYKKTNLVFVRMKSGGSFQPVQLDCLGEISTWAPVGSGGQYEYAQLDLGAVHCENGPHVAESKGPFGLTVWGLDIAASYAYPAGGNVGVVNPVVVKPNPN